MENDRLDGFPADGIHRPVDGGQFGNARLPGAAMLRGRGVDVHRPV